MTENQRRSPRQRMLKGARAVFNDGRSTINCTVRDLSESGGRLRLASALGVPDHFTLVFDDGRKDRLCRIIWRSASEVGVAFGPPVQTERAERERA